MSQSSARLSWSEDELKSLLAGIMKGIHSSCLEYGDSAADYVKGADIAGSRKVADAMLAYGVV